MKKLYTMFLVICFGFVCSAAFAAEADWKIDGVWDFVSEIPETQVLQGTTYSSNGLGTITMRMREIDGVEYFDKYVYFGNGKSCVNAFGEKTEWEYLVGPMKNQLDWGAYEPGREYEFDAGTVSIHGQPAKETMKLRQVAADKIEGTVSITSNVGITVSGTITATRRPDKPLKPWTAAGKWNYDAVVPEQQAEIDGMKVIFSAEEIGTIDMNMTTGEIAGREYYDNAVMSFEGTYSLNIGGLIDEGTYGGKDDRYEFDKDLYTPGEDMLYQKELQLHGKTITGRLVCNQVEKNKFAGTLYYMVDDIVIAKGELTAARDTNSGGCNAGFGELALLALMGVAYSKTKSKRQALKLLEAVRQKIRIKTFAKAK